MRDEKAGEYAAVLDVGSNAVRLAIYDGLNRAPVKIHNERNVCSLGAGLASTGRLNPEGVQSALLSLSRFSSLIDAMKIRHVRAVATAALRDAEDGAEFIARAEKECGIRISVVDGEEEARLSARGVLMNGMGADGIIGDYGGGSLELIAVEKGKVKATASLPVGSHRLQALKTRAARTAVIEKHLADVSFLRAHAGKDFYALGGSWRAMGRAHMQLARHSLPMLDHYEIGGKKAARFAAQVSRRSAAALERATGFSGKRARDVSVAALAMEKLFEKIRPGRLVFSATGLREGLVYDMLKPSVRSEDALLASCEKTAASLSRSRDLSGFSALSSWIMPLFDDADAETLRLVEASCLLSDVGWLEHEDYRARHAFERLLVMPYYGIDHAGRAFLALSQHVRHAGRELPEATRGAQKILGQGGVAAAVAAGLAQRLAYLLTGGALSLLAHWEIAADKKSLALGFRKGGPAPFTLSVAQALEELAASLGKKPVTR